VLAKLVAERVLQEWVCGFGALNMDGTDEGGSGRGGVEEGVLNMQTQPQARAEKREDEQRAIEELAHVAREIKTSTVPNEERTYDSPSHASLHPVANDAPGAESSVSSVGTHDAENADEAQDNLLANDAQSGQDEMPTPSSSNVACEVVVSARDRKLRNIEDQLRALGMAADEARMLAEEQLQIQEDEEMAMRLIYVDNELGSERTLRSANANGEANSSTPSDSEKPVCIICLEPDQLCPKLSTCEHTNLCLVCMSKLSRLECPTCRVPLEDIELIEIGTVSVKHLVAERMRAENESWKNTLQVVFAGPRSALPRQSRDEVLLFSKREAKAPSSKQKPEEEVSGPESQDAGDGENPRLRFFPRGDDSLEADERGAFRAQLALESTGVHLSVLQRHSLAAKRMVLEDLRVLRPDVVVICGFIDDSSDTGIVSLEPVLRWDRVIKTGSSLPRIWLLHFGLADVRGQQEHQQHSPSEKRPRRPGDSTSGASTEEFNEKDAARLKKRPMKRAAVVSAIESFQPSERPNAVFFTCESRPGEKIKHVFATGGGRQPCNRAGNVDHTSLDAMQRSWQWNLLENAVELARLARATRSSFVPAGTALPVNIPGVPRNLFGSSSLNMPGRGTSDSAAELVNNGIGTVLTSLSTFMAWGSTPGRRPLNDDDAPAVAVNAESQHEQPVPPCHGTDGAREQRDRSQEAPARVTRVEDGDAERSGSRRTSETQRREQTGSRFDEESDLLDGLDVMANAWNNAVTSVVSWWSTE